MNRRGVVYTLISVLLLLVVASLFFSQSQRTSYDSHSAVANRVLSVDKFIKNLESDSQRAAYIAGYRTMIAMEQLATTQGDYFTDADATFLEIFVSGNLSTEEFTIMQNSSFAEYLLKVQAEAGKQGILFNASLLNLSLWQVEPWEILVNYTLELNVTDGRGTSRWSTVKTFTGSVPVEELRDPLFTVGTFSRVQRVIRRTNVTSFVDDVGDANDTTELLVHINNSFYIAEGRGPSMLMRFEGNFSDSPYGFESIIDTVEIGAQGLLVYNTRSVVDYKYFSGVGADHCNIQNLPSKIKFATSDIGIYEVEGQLEYDAC